MNGHRCCEVAASGPGLQTTGERHRADYPAAPAFARRCLDIAGWIVPSAILALLPKCPACLAAYIALGTGVGLSVSTATYLRILMVLLCAGSLISLATGMAMRLTRFVETALRNETSKVAVPVTFSDSQKN